MTKRIYNKQQWQKIRAIKLTKNPVCEACRKARATDVDHITRVKAGGKAWALENLQSLCHACHSRKTATEANNEPVMMPGCDESGRPLNANHWWNKQTETKKISRS